jgi:methylglutaconyl-CoA hydratase
MPKSPPPTRPRRPSRALVEIQQTGLVLTFTLNNPDRGNEVTATMFQAMLAELRSQSKSSQPSARVLRIRARGKVFCTGRERAGRDKKSIRAEAACLIAFSYPHLLFDYCCGGTWRRLRIWHGSGDCLRFRVGLAIVCDFALVASHVSLCFPEMRAGLPPAAIMAYLGEYALPRFAFPLVLFGEPFSPQRALEIGLISQVCPAENLSSEADALVTRILKLDPDATRRCKQFFLTAQNNSYEKNCSLAIEALTQGTLAALGRKK